MIGYFNIKTNKNPNLIGFVRMIEVTVDYFNENYNLDRIIYDYKNKPINPKYKNYLDMLLDIIDENNTLVVRSIFQLGNTKVDIYKSLARLKLKKIKLIVNGWDVDILSIMKNVLELSVNDLSVYENIQLYKNHCFDVVTEDNIYRKLAGYLLDENYISKETNMKIACCNYKERGK